MIIKENRLMYKGKSYTNNQDIADVMNEHFCTIGKNLQSSLPNNDVDGFKNYLPASIMNSFVLSHVTKDDILREIKLLDPKKSSGPDGIGAKIIKLCPEIFGENLLFLFNHYIDLGQYPSEMKIARVISLYKKGAHSDPNNYPTYKHPFMF